MGRVVNYHSHIDQEATAANAELVLTDYTHRRARVRRWSMDLQSPAMDGMPRNDSVENTAELKIVDHLSDSQFVYRCDHILECIESDEYRSILKYTYYRPLATVEDVQERLNMTSSTYYRQRTKALNAFAELWPPKPSALLVYTF